MLDGSAARPRLAGCSQSELDLTRTRAAETAGCPPALLRRLADDPHEAVRRAAANNPGCPGSVLSVLLDHSDGHMRIASALNPSLPTPAARRLSRSADHVLVDRLADNPNCALRRLAQQRHLRSTVAKNPACTRSLLAALAADPDNKVREAAASNPACPPDMLAAAAGDSSDAVRIAVAIHEGCPPRTLRILADPRHQEESVVVAASLHPNCPADAIERLAGSLDDIGMQGLSIGNPQCPQHILRRLASDNILQFSIAGHPNCPPDLLMAFAQTGDYTARSAVATNPSSGAAPLEVLAGDADDLLRLAVAHNPSVPIHLLHTMTADPHSDVAGAAREMLEVQGIAA